jgi:hypothetical protein
MPSHLPGSGSRRSNPVGMVRTVAHAAAIIRACERRKVVSGKGQFLSVPGALADRLRRAAAHALDNLRSRFAVHIGHLQVNGPFPQAAKQDRRGNRWILPFSWLSKDLVETNKMRVKMGTVVPKMGTFVHLNEIPGDYRAAMAMALHAELGSTHRAIKSAMRWTGASERTVKYWFAGERGRAAITSCRSRVIPMPC